MTTKKLSKKALKRAARERQQKQRVLASISRGQKDSVPKEPDSWKLINTVDSWSIYVVHDPCHDGGSFQDDRNTVVALHNGRGERRVIGREVPYNFALKIARGEV